MDADGADIARGGFPKWPFLYLTKMKAAETVPSVERDSRYGLRVTGAARDFWG